MGADLYLNSLFEPHQAEWRTRFDAAVELRDGLPEDSAEWAQADADVDECRAQLYAEGYFRDPYNDLDLLWKFGLSWADDIIPMLDTDRLPLNGVRQLLRILQQQEEEFERNMVGLAADRQDYFRRRYAGLQNFLNLAIARGETIACFL